MEPEKYKVNYDKVITVHGKQGLEYIVAYSEDIRQSVVYKVETLGLDEVKSFLERLAGDTGLKINTIK